jgi:hypothetical protein
MHEDASSDSCALAASSAAARGHAKRGQPGQRPGLRRRIKSDNACPAMMEALSPSFRAALPQGKISIATK